MSSVYLLQYEKEASQVKKKKKKEVSAHCPLHCFGLELFRSNSSMKCLPIPHLP